MDLFFHPLNKIQCYAINYSSFKESTVKWITVKGGRIVFQSLKQALIPLD